MRGFPSPWGGNGGGDDALFDAWDAFVPDRIPAPDRFLEGHDVLAGREHLAFHRLTRDLFEVRTVYDMTFNYNLARLNLDTRHPDAGYRYAVEDADRTEMDRQDADRAEAERADADRANAVDTADVERVLRAEFTPTTPFCPQTHTLTIGSFRAWNGLRDRHEYDLVRVRAAPMHHRSEEINDELADLEAEFLATGAVPSAAGEARGPGELDAALRGGGEGRGKTDAPF